MSAVLEEDFVRSDCTLVVIWVLSAEAVMAALTAGEAGGEQPIRE